MDCCFESTVNPHQVVKWDDLLSIPFRTSKKRWPFMTSWMPNLFVSCCKFYMLFRRFRRFRWFRWFRWFTHSPEWNSWWIWSWLRRENRRQSGWFEWTNLPVDRIGWRRRIKSFRKNECTNYTREWIGWSPAECLWSGYKICFECEWWNELVYLSNTEGCSF